MFLTDKLLNCMIYFGFVYIECANYLLDLYLSDRLPTYGYPSWED